MFRLEFILTEVQRVCLFFALNNSTSDLKKLKDALGLTAANVWVDRVKGTPGGVASELGPYGIMVIRFGSLHTIYRVSEASFDVNYEYHLISP